ncbi:MAG: hypothetical protein LBK71_00105 [Verrucomicrobiales bacterium]|jgi:hypothetical protein|nr:hypothetical protein [Verrucomicrobiales bacterium]
MTATELELKAKRFTAKMNDKQLGRLHEIIEDIRDVRAYDHARKRLAASDGKTVPWETVKARLGKKFGLKFS